MRHPARAQARAQLRLLAGDEVGAEAARGRERVDAHHRDAAAGARLAARRVPLDVAEQVVDRALGMLLAQAAAHGGDILMLRKERGRALEPARGELAVAVEELHVVELRLASRAAAGTPRCAPAPR